MVSPCHLAVSFTQLQWFFTFPLFLEHTSHIFIFIGSSFSLKLSFIGGYCLTLLSFWYSVGYISHQLLVLVYYVWSSPFYLVQKSTPPSSTSFTFSYLFFPLLRTYVEKEMATHSSTSAWKIPWMEEPGRLQFIGSQRVRHNWATHFHSEWVLE